MESDRMGFRINNEKEDGIMAKDPVCGMEVDEKQAAGTAVHDGKTYYFCSTRCKTTFEKSPAKYAQK
jgi:YHS domain-containing protein